MATILDVRQSLYRGILQQIMPWLSNKTLDVLLASINADLTPPFKIDANNPASLVINIGPSTVVNTISNRNKSASFLGSNIPVFTSGTVTFPSSSGGNIVASPGGSTVLTLPPGEYAQVLLAIDESNNLNVVVGTPNAVLANALVPVPNASTQPFGYVTVFNNSGTIQNITQSNCYQFSGSGSGSGSGGGQAQEVALTMGTTSQVVTFPVPQGSSSYIINGAIYNSIDPNPEYFPVTIINKTTTTTTFEWNQPLPTGNYFLDWSISPGLAEQAGEAPVTLGATSVTVTIPLSLGSTNYIVNAEMADYADAFPQFQPVVITQKTNTTFTVSWNAPTDSSSVVIAWQLAAYT